MIISYLCYRIFN